jgi:hypothetical protein
MSEGRKYPQIGLVDRTNFPEGTEHLDPAFAAFFQTLRFHHRYECNI